MIGGVSLKKAILLVSLFLSASTAPYLQGVSTVRSVDATLQKFTKTITNFAPILRSLGSSHENLEAISLLGITLQVVADAKKEVSRKARSRGSCKNNSSEMNREDVSPFLEILEKGAKLPSAKEYARLKLLVDSDLKADHKKVLASILRDPVARSYFMIDFFRALRSDVIAEVASLEKSSIQSDVLETMREFFQQYFGMESWGPALSSWMNSIIDTTQALMNAYIDMMQDCIHLFVLQYEVSHGDNPAVNAIIGQVESYVQSGVDQLQSEINVAIDSHQQVLV